MILRMLTAHPASVGETYFGHLAFAWRFGGSMLAGGALSLLHGLLPFLCTTSGSRRIRALHALLEAHPARRRVMQAQSAADLGADSAFNWSI